ncbi:Hypothetical_protein [Hexamita inflata]|uniref:Hypothetical_protein n=1 Tax=Hexamita inflata TaxID=28002 RepID=A0ABP1JG44_9EUKA
MNVSVSKCYISSSSVAAGLIGFSKSNTTILNSKLTDSNISSSNMYSAGFIQTAVINATIQNCIIQKCQINTSGFVSVAGCNIQFISSNLLYCQIQSDIQSGGILGYSGVGYIISINDCLITSLTTTCKAYNCGSIIGRSDSNTIIQQSHVKNSSISSVSSTGGFLGHSYSNITIMWCSIYNSTIISSYSCSGGFVGLSSDLFYVFNSQITLMNIFSDIYAGGFLANGAQNIFIIGSKLQSIVLQANAYFNLVIGCTIATLSIQTSSSEWINSINNVLQNNCLSFTGINGC